MHGLPPNFDASCFQGACLDSICIAAYQVDFDFEKEISVSVVAAFAINNKTYEIPISSIEIGALIGKCVRNASLAGGNIVITFENDDVLTIFEIEDDFESYTLYLKHTRVVV